MAGNPPPVPISKRVLTFGEYFSRNNFIPKESYICFSHKNFSSFLEIRLSIAFCTRKTSIYFVKSVLILKLIKFFIPYS